MGMDVYGRNPKSKEGEYFRASIWSWHPLHSLTCELCKDLLPEEMLMRMGYNDGAGPEDQETCDAMASRFEVWMEHHAGGVQKQEAELACPPWAKMFSAAFGQDIGATYDIDDEHLKEWVRFLRACGGFKVW